MYVQSKGGVVSSKDPIISQEGPGNKAFHVDGQRLLYFHTRIPTNPAFCTRIG